MDSSVLNTDSPSIWSRLQKAADDPSDPLRLVTLATVDSAGRPDARLMLLRGADPDRARLWFHADKASRKVQQAMLHPKACVVAYDPGSGFQYRLRGTLVIHVGDAVADRHRQQADLASAHLTSLVAEPAKDDDAAPHADPIGRDLIRSRFAVLELCAESIECMSGDDPLETGSSSRGGNRRET